MAWLFKILQLRTWTAQPMFWSFYILDKLCYHSFHLDSFIVFLQCSFEPLCVSFVFMSCQGCAAVCCLLPCISWVFWGYDYWFSLSFFEFGVLSYALFSCSSISSINTLLSLVFRFSRFSFLLPALMFLVSCLCVVFPLCYFRFCFVSFCHLHQFPCCCTCKAVVTFPE